MTTSYFELRPDDLPNGGVLDARHRWSLPGVSCDACGATWAMTGIAYPTIDLSQLSTQGDYLNPRVVDLQTFLTLRDVVGQLLPPEAVIVPGTEFGPLVGRASGAFEDFAWLNPWTLLASERCAMALTDTEVHLPVSALAQIDAKKAVALHEYEIEPLGVLAGVDAPICTSCGRAAILLPPDPILLGSSMPPNRDLFRLKDAPTLIVATNRFVDAVHRLGLRGLNMRPLNVT